MADDRKRLLFVLPSGEIGGTRTSLYNLVSNMDKERYDIDILLMLRQGPFVQKYEEISDLLPVDRTLLASWYQIRLLIRQCRFAALIRRAWLTAKAKAGKTGFYEYCYKKAAEKYSGRYDCVISFQEKVTTEFAQYIKADRRIAFVHSEPSRTVSGMGEAHFSEVSNRFDRVVFVSDACMNEFKEKTHIDHSKCVRIYNTFDIEQITGKSREYCIEKENGLPVFVTVGRFCEQKSFDRAVNSAARLKAEGYRFKWYLIGDGELFDQIKALAAEKGVEDCVIFTGRLNNPYPYILSADAMILTSVFEAHPMVATEAFILGTPVISADFASASESIKNGEYGILCDNSEEGIYSGVKQILSDGSVLGRLRDNLSDFSYDNRSIVKQVEDLCEGLM